jgi:acyl carrier protein
VSEIETAIQQWVVNVAAATRDAAALTGESRLMDEGWLDSLHIVELAEFLEKRFSVSIDLDDVVPEHFATIGTVAALVRRAPRSSR